MVKHKLLCPGI